MSGAPLLDVKDLRVVFPGTDGRRTFAVDGVSFTAADGAVTGLLGPNGAGTTTTLRMLYTLMRPDEGRIMIDDVDPAEDPEGARLHLGVLPDQSGLYPRLTAREHIQYFDHSTPWNGHGYTSPHNAAPLCGWHNRWKSRGYRTWRDPDGMCR